MSQAIIENIMKEIEALSDDDLEVLEERLAHLDEAKWQREAEEAREIARAHGIDQASIDQAINKLRYR